jgi:tight adherence protein B
MIAQLPDALDLMARGLKVGHPLNTSIGAVAREMPDPIGTEFGLVFDQVSYGEDWSRLSTTCRNASRSRT